MTQFRYFPAYPQGAQLGDDACDLCGHRPAITGIRLGLRMDEPRNVCADCLAADKVAASIPQWIQQDVRDAVDRLHADWSAMARADLVAARVYELAHTPPVPWLQNNEWPLCGDDFAIYQGELTQEALKRQHGGIVGGKAVLRTILERVVPNWEQDDVAIDAEWRDLGNFLAVFVFRCLDQDVYVVQTA